MCEFSSPFGFSSGELGNLWAVKLFDFLSFLEIHCWQFIFPIYDHVKFVEWEWLASIYLVEIHSGKRSLKYDNGNSRSRPGINEIPFSFRCSKQISLSIYIMQFPFGSPLVNLWAMNWLVYVLEMYCWPCTFEEVIQIRGSLVRTNLPSGYPLVTVYWNMTTEISSWCSVCWCLGWNDFQSINYSRWIDSWWPYH